MKKKTRPEKPPIVTTFSATVPLSQKEVGKLLAPLLSRGGHVIFSSTYEPAKPARNSVLVFVHDDDDDSLPLILCDENGNWLRELSRKEADKLASQGVVTGIVLTHPRADRYGIPMLACGDQHYWAAMIGNLGMRPDEDVELTLCDSGDDSAGNRRLTVMVPKTLALKLAKKTSAVEEIADRICLGRRQNIESAMRHHSRKTDAEISQEIETQTAELQKAGGRGIDLAENLDALRIIRDMRGMLHSQPL